MTVLTFGRRFVGKELQVNGNNDAYFLERSATVDERHFTNVTTQNARRPTPLRQGVLINTAPHCNQNFFRKQESDSNRRCRQQRIRLQNPDSPESPSSSRRRKNAPASKYVSGIRSYFRTPNVITRSDQNLYFHIVTLRNRVRRLTRRRSPSRNRHTPRPRKWQKERFCPTRNDSVLLITTACISSSTFLQLPSSF